MSETEVERLESMLRIKDAIIDVLKMQRRDLMIISFLLMLCIIILVWPL